MSKAEKDELFELIKSLTKAEKRYFKVFFSKHVIGDQNKYMLLYDFLSKQETFNWKKLEKKFKGEKFLKNYSKTKGYLIELILKSLRSFKAGKTPKDIITEKMQNVRILYNKGLFAQSERLLSRLKKYCYGTEEFNLLLEILEFEHWKAFDHSMVRENVSKERFQVITKIHNLFEYGILYSKILAIVIKEDNWIGEERTKIIEEVLSHPLARNLDSALSLTAEFSYNSIHSLTNHLLGNYEMTCFYQAKSVDSYEANPVYLKSNYKGYLLALGNLVTMHYNNRDFIKMTKDYHRLRHAHQRESGYEQLKFEQKHMFGMLTAKVNRDFASFDNMVEDFEAELIQFRESLTLIKETDIYFNIAIVYFEQERFSEALDWVNKLLNHPNIQERQYLYIYTRAIDLLIHSELGNLDLAAYKSGSLYKYLRNHKKLDLFSKAVLNFVKAISNHRDKFERLEAYSKFRTELLSINKTDYEKIANDQLDYIQWLDGKLNLVS